MSNISFSSQKYGYVIVPGLIYRGRKHAMVDFLIDTGASTTMVDPRIMSALGYTVACAEHTGAVTVSGPSGSETGYRVKAHRLLIHSSEFRLDEIDIVCIRPERNVEALLGLNFLRHFHYCIDHKACLMTMQSK